MYIPADFSVQAVKRTESGFAATVCIKGKRSLAVAFDTSSNKYAYTPVAKVISQEAIDAFLEKIEADLSAEIFPHLFAPSFKYRDEPTLALDTVIGRLLFDEQLKEQARSLLRRICYITPDGKLYRLPSKLKPTPENLADLRASDWFLESFVLLNELELEDAIERLLQADAI